MVVGGQLDLELYGGGVALGIGQVVLLPPGQLLRDRLLQAGLIRGVACPGQEAGGAGGLQELAGGRQVTQGQQ